MSRSARINERGRELATALIGAALADDSDSFTQVVYEIDSPELNGAVLAALASECVGLLHGLASALPSEFDGPGQVWVAMQAERA